MNVKIDIDIAENILKSYARRNRDQLRVYGILLGVVEKDTYHVKSCIHGYIYEAKENTEDDVNSTGINQSEISVVEFKRLNDSIANSLFNSYHTNFPNYVILGGFSTNKDLFRELYYLFNTINGIHIKTMENKNKILLLIDPWHKEDNKINYGIQIFDWRFEEETKVMVYKHLPYIVVDSKIKGSILHSNIINKDQMLLNLQNSDVEKLEGFTEIIEEIKKSVDEEIKFLPNTNDSFNNINLYNIKKQLMLTDKFLLVIETYLNVGSKHNEELIHQIDYLLQELVYYFNREEVLKIVEQEFKDNQMIDALSNLLNLQIKITEKINEFNL